MIVKLIKPLRKELWFLNQLYFVVDLKLLPLWWSWSVARHFHWRNEVHPRSQCWGLLVSTEIFPFWLAGLLGAVFWARHRGGWKRLSRRSHRYFESSEPWSGPQPEGEAGNIGFLFQSQKRTWRFCNIKVRVVKMSMISRWGTFLMSWTRKTRRSPWRSSRSWWWLWRRLAGGNRNLRRWIIVHH